MAKKELDKLSREVAQALAAGTSYGKWKARQPRVEVEAVIPDGWRACEYCSKPFKPKVSQRFCDIGCRTASYKERTGRK